MRGFPADQAVGHQAGAGPPSPASIWDLPARGARGPRPRHDRAAIAATAVRIADAEGLAAVAMRRVASELGMATMSLYNYVPAKEHLAELMIDHLAAEYAYSSLPAPDPRSAIAELAGQARDIARRHPWLPGLLHRPMPPGPNGLRYLDYFLGLLAGSGLDTGAKLELIAMISGFATTYGAMQRPAAPTPTWPRRSPPPDRYAARTRSSSPASSASSTWPDPPAVQPPGRVSRTANAADRAAGPLETDRVR